MKVSVRARLDFSRSLATVQVVMRISSSPIGRRTERVVRRVTRDTLKRLVKNSSLTIRSFIVFNFADIRFHRAQYDGDELVEFGQRRHDHESILQDTLWTLVSGDHAVDRQKFIAQRQTYNGKRRK